MMFARRQAIPLLALVLAQGGAFPVAFGALRDRPPAGLVPEGVWRLDPTRSDDAEAVVDKARDALTDDRARGLDGGGRRGAGAGGYSGGGMTRGGIGGAGLGGGGDFGHDAEVAQARLDRRDDALLGALGRNPQTLMIRAAERELAVSADEDEQSCEAGVRSALSDRLGDAERECGWQGSVWVVETTRPTLGTRTDRYDFSRDGRLLTYTTLLRGEGLPRLKLRRVYERASVAPQRWPPPPPPPPPPP
jgi:hypothetical protein